MNPKDFSLYIPKYLSPESEREFYESIKQFPDNVYKKFYSTKLIDQKIIFQGDGIFNLPHYNYIIKKEKLVNSIILSNTCDIDLSNNRIIDNQILYTPIVKLNNYKELLLYNGIDNNRIVTHLNDIKLQRITQIFYLPKINDDFDESIVFLDRITNIPNSFIDRDKIKEMRIFTLTNYSFYLFVVKLSMHFSRIKEGVDRDIILT